jgi:serine/threonine protein kinase
MEGGRILGSPGGYGCAFRPPLRCQSGNIPKNKILKVGKITEKQEAEREIQTANRLRLFPLAPNYFLLPDPDSCSLAPPKKQTEPDLSICLQSDFARKTPFHKLKQIFSPYGGISLFTSLQRSNFDPRGFDFFDCMRHLLELGATLAVNGVIHFDLHPGNILLDTKKVPRAIDFGRSLFSDQINKQTVHDRIFGILFLRNDLHPFIINQQPPELDVLQAIQAGFSRKEASRLTLLHIPALRLIQSILYVPFSTSYEELSDFSRTSKAIEEKDMVGLWKTYWPQFDAWSIGILLLQILKQQLLFPDFQTQWETRKESTIKTLRGLLHVSPYKRFDCVKALKEYDPDNAWLHRYGADWLSSLHA